MPAASKVSKRLLAHARLYRRIARESWNEETALRLTKLADECSAAAAEAEHEASGQAPAA